MKHANIHIAPVNIKSDLFIQRPNDVKGPNETHKPVRCFGLECYGNWCGPTTAVFHPKKKILVL